ncbi:LPXTG cell wall anchor domain-containing protein [Peptostreptococcus equinus]|uniref:LPXTG cell wall anchor domain-containing protein n=1 Tax=Peptostreptococcus equinus TaxID=3003601 RepID=A0ABY7JPT6_9FIRM|nr:LPXTG cell wall anchor domain-containing protein [Peptostreptococcus sp. CBA3647]WAW14168.1 LPXTG cell wall anchor domain-containing protein [Peptostreptococcus sp. CBA3647]
MKNKKIKVVATSLLVANILQPVNLINAEDAVNRETSNPPAKITESVKKTELERAIETAERTYNRYKDNNKSVSDKFLSEINLAKSKLNDNEEAQKNAAKNLASNQKIFFADSKAAIKNAISDAENKEDILKIIEKAKIDNRRKIEKDQEELIKKLNEMDKLKKSSIDYIESLEGLSPKSKEIAKNHIGGSESKEDILDVIERATIINRRKKEQSSSESEPKKEELNQSEPNKEEPKQDESNKEEPKQDESNKEELNQNGSSKKEQEHNGSIEKESDNSESKKNGSNKNNTKIENAKNRSKVLNNSVNKKQNEKKKVLPNTGDGLNSMIIAIIGIFTSMVLILLGLKSKKISIKNK